MKLSLYFTIFLVILISGICCSAEGTAEEDFDEPQVEIEQEETAPVSGDSDDAAAQPKVDVNIVYAMPDNPFSMVVNGEVAAILFGFRNTGDEVLRVVGVQGHFTQPGQYDKFIRNITRMPYLAEVQPGEETTVNYRFKTNFEPAQIGLAVFVEFADTQDRGYKYLAYAKDISIADPVSTFDLQTAFVYLCGIAGVVLTGYLVSIVFAPKKVPAKSVKVSTEKQGKYDESWIPEQHKVLRSPRRASKSKRN